MIQNLTLLKRTQNDWCPCFKDAEGLGCVEVTLTQTGPVDFEDFKYRVCVWGDDDMGMELDYPQDKLNEAVNMFYTITNLDFVNVEYLKNSGFVPA